MSESVYLWRIISGLIPVVSGLFWAAVMFFSVSDSRTHLDKRVKLILLAYFCTFTFAWFSMLIYTYTPGWFPYINSFTYFSFLTTPILFYHFAYNLTEPPGKKLPYGHYFLPAIIGGALLVWSVFVPFDVQVRLAADRGAIVADYPFYSRFFLSKPILCLLFNMVYSVLAFVRLIRYYRYIGNIDTRLRPSAGWVIAMISMMVVTMALTLIMSINARGTVLFTGIYITTTVITALLQLILGYNIIRRNFLLYMPLPLSAGVIKGKTEVAEKKNGLTVTQSEDATPNRKRAYTRRTPLAETSEGEIRYRKLTRVYFEAYMNNVRPWLDPQLKITDLLEPLQTNRTILSGFVNQTYGMNFNRYVNSLRLAELDRLRGEPENAGKDSSILLKKAGFASLRTYQRAVEANRESPPNAFRREKTMRNEKSKERKK